MVIGNNNTFKTNIQFWDKRIQKENANSFKLLLSYSHKRFTYCVFDNDKDEFLGIKHQIINNLNDVLTILKSEIFNWNFDSIIASIQSLKSTILPDSFFDKKMMQKYLYFNEEINTNELLILNDKLKYIDANLVYSFEKDLKLILEEKFIKIKITSQASIFVDSILRKASQSKKNLVFIDISNKSFDIGIVKKSKLFLYNNFFFHTKEDFLYYVLNCYNTLNLDSKKDKLLISGEFKKDEILDSIDEYLDLVSLQKKDNSYLYSNVFNNVPEFYFHKIYNIIKCV